MFARRTLRLSSLVSQGRSKTFPRHMSGAAPLRIGSTVPDFSIDSTLGRVDSFHGFIGDQWCLLCSHPQAFTPVCTTELGQMARMKPEFDSRNCKIAAIACDAVDVDIAWVKDIEEVGSTTMNFPIFSDTDRSVCEQFGMLMDGEFDGAMPVTVRSVYVIGPDKKVKAMITYPPSTGRNFDEIVRVVDSLQLTHEKKCATPVNWKQGDKVCILPTVSNDDAKAMFGSFETVKPYLRVIESSQIPK